MDYLPLKATTINNPRPVTLELYIDSTDSDMLDATITNEPHPFCAELFNQN